MTNCANIVSPKGGPKDTTPPEITKCIPENYSSNFNEKKISIYFNEFVQLKDLKSQMIISPPFKEDPEVKLRGKALIIKSDEDLKENTTYTFYFGNSISDITEANSVRNFQYVFSTGTIVDSLTITGKILNSFTLEPEKDVYVMLYTNNEDSIPYKEIPYYVTKTNEQGNFYLKNLKNTPFKLFVLQDNNSNYLYDLPNEKIAFADSLIFPEQYIAPVIPDSLVNDTAYVDSLTLNNINKENIFYLFEEIDSTQRLVDASLIKKGKLKFIFKFPTKNVNIRPLNFAYPEDWKIDEFNTSKDTLICWYNNIEKDTLLLEVSDNKIVIDTSELYIQKTFMSEKEGEVQKKEKLLIKSNAERGFDYFKTLQLLFSNPLKRYNFSETLLIENEEDTIVPKCSFVDSLKRRVNVNYIWKQNSSYKIIIPDSLFYDIFDFSNDTTIFDFRTKSIEDYGVFIINIEIKNPGKKYIIQLLEENGERVLKEILISNSTTLKFDNLNPGKYKIKAIEDKNNNSKWDTGNYLKKIQPEKVYYFDKEINIRANWDVEEDWKL